MTELETRVGSLFVCLLQLLVNKGLISESEGVNMVTDAQSLFESSQHEVSEDD